MRLLFDANLSPRLVAQLADVFPDAAHVFDFGSIAMDDKLVWEIAKAQGYAIVSKDSDFHHMSFVHGPPPKVVWLRVGNTTTRFVADMLRKHAAAIAHFEKDATAAFLIVSP